MRKLIVLGFLCLFLHGAGGNVALAQYDLLVPFDYFGQARSDAEVSTPLSYVDPPPNFGGGYIAYAPSGATAVDASNIISFMGSGDSRLIMGAAPGTFVNGTASTIFQGSHLGADSCYAFKDESAISDGIWFTEGAGDQLYGLIYMAGMANEAMEFSSVRINDSWVISEHGWLSGVINTRDQNDVPGVLMFGVNGLPPIFAPGGIIVEVFEPDPGVVEASAGTNIATMGTFYNNSISATYSTAYAAMVTVEGNLPTPLGIPPELQNNFFPTGGGGSGNSGGGSSGGGDSGGGSSSGGF